MTRQVVTLLFLLPLISKARTTFVGTIESGGLVRTYRLYIPANYHADSSPRPLLLNLHGLGANGLLQESYGDFRSIADTAGFLIVHPDATLLPVPGFWNTGLLPSGPDDLRFLSDLIDTISAQYRVDAGRVYSAGFSNGGFMSYYLASHLSQKVAAVASVSGSILPQTFSTMPAPSRPVPVMEIHGTLDATVPYFGSVNATHVDTVIQYWVTKNNCSPTPQVRSVPNTVLLDGCNAKRYLWSGGAAGSTVELFKVTNGGHAWPGATLPLGIGLTNHDFKASREIWRFLRQHRLTSPSGGSVTKNSLQLHTVPNPAQEFIRIELAEPDGVWTTKGAEEGGIAEVLDLTGRVVLSASGSTVRVSSLPTGNYILRYTTAAGVGTVQFIKK